MNEELLAWLLLFIRSKWRLIGKYPHNGFIHFFEFSKRQPKSPVHQQADKLFKQHCWHLKGNDDLNVSFVNADRLLEQKRTASRFDYIALITLQANLCWDLPEERLLIPRMRSSLVVRASDANAPVATVLGSAPASVGTVESEGRQKKQCWIYCTVVRK